MLHAVVFDVPVKPSLPFMATIRADGIDPEGEFGDHVVDEVDRACLVVAPIDLQRADSSGVVDGRELIATDLSAVSRA
jgi:hypothetical protein